MFDAEVLPFIAAVIVTILPVLCIIFWSKSKPSPQQYSTSSSKLKTKTGASASANEVTDVNRCTSPGCVRCKNYKVLTNNLSVKLSDYFESQQLQQEQDTHRLRDSEYLERLRYSFDHSHELLTSKKIGDNVPTVFKLHDLETKPFYQKHDMCLKDVENLENSFTEILNEFTFVYEDLLAGQNEGWFSNSVPTGMWSVFHLYNQGVKVGTNCAKCPKATEIIENMDSFMSAIAFGNATFSVLQAGTKISAHYGPCNLRVRCHLGLQVPTGCTLTVANQKRQWIEGETLLFDDSYLHEVSHDGIDEPRIVFMVDLWHPQVTEEERKALKYLFAI